jgi:thiosulfate reductase cytochrome b subunit
MRLLIVTLLAVAVLPITSLRAQGISSMHPAFTLRDASGAAISGPGAEVSADNTCGGCHDSAYIQSHSLHNERGALVSCIDCHVRGGEINIEETVPDAQGQVDSESVVISSPTIENCASCHGLAHVGEAPLQFPAEFTGPGTNFWLTLQTGAIYSAQEQRLSYLNLKDKDALDYPWDVHAGKMVGCTACHYSPNNPTHTEEREANPFHLRRDPRGPATADYLHRPDHRLQTANCAYCHKTDEAHDYLPYSARHLAAVECESCHIPSIKGPALQTSDQTVVTLSGAGARVFRGMEAGVDEQFNVSYLEGYEPFLFGKRNRSGETTLAPFNPVTGWYWQSGKTNERAPLELVARAYLDGDGYAPEVLGLFDVDGNGSIDKQELMLDSQQKVELIAGRLAALGLVEPRIAGEVEFHAIGHGVVPGRLLSRDCSFCHGSVSRLTEDVPLSDRTPYGAELAIGKNTPVLIAAKLEKDEKGALFLNRTDFPAEFSNDGDRYIFGFSSRIWSGTLGFVLFLMTVLMLMVHGGYRVYTAKGRKTEHQAPTEKIYLYGAYERIWHWLMAFSVIMLIVTGLEVHFPEGLRIFGFTSAVNLHNIAALVMMANAFLSLFYHLASGGIRQFVPPKENFFGSLLAHINFYSAGIFAGEPHPMTKSHDNKLNPLQQLTYLGLLNVLFPLQIITGLLIWGAERWPVLSSAVGGLSIIAPLHNLGSWLFLTFLVMHVYLTTTGHTPLANVRAMITGYEDIEKTE